MALDSADTQVLSLAVTPDGTVFAGTGPSGQVIDLTDPKHPASRPDPKVQYIWDLAADAQGNLFAATGPNGQLWKRSRDGKWSLLYDSKATHLLCVALAPDGTVYAGSDGEGLIYRVGRDGKATVLFDAPQSEIRTCCWRPTARSTPARPPRRAAEGRVVLLAVLLARRRSRPGRAECDSSGSDRSWRTAGAADQRARSLPRRHAAGARPAAPKPPAGGSAAPKPITPGDNAVYRLDADGVPRESSGSRP